VAHGARVGLPKLEKGYRALDKRRMPTIIATKCPGIRRL
jgi:hypothetical protein